MRFERTSFVRARSLARRLLPIAGVAVIVVAASLAGYAKGRQDAVAATSVAPTEAPAASPSAPAARPTPSIAPPLTPIALGTADIGTILFVDGYRTWQFDAKAGQLRLRAADAGQPFSRGHAMSHDDGFAQSGFIDARKPEQAMTPLNQRAIPSVSDMSPDGTKVAYVLNNKIRLYQPLYFNSTWSDVAPDHLFSAVRWSPGGRYLAALGPPAVLDPAWPKGVRPNRGDVPGTVFIVDVATNAVRPLWVPEGTPRPPLPPARPSVQIVSWSPDEQYVLLRHNSVASGEDQRGRDMFAVEVSTGKATPLGTAVTVWSWISWRAPHTLAYVDGHGYDASTPKQVRIWTPEAGIRDVSAPGEVAFSPSWDDEGRVFFVHGRAPATPSGLSTAGDDMRLAVFDPGTGQTTELLADARYAEEGARLSEDGKTLLVARRRLDKPLLEMWTAARDGSDPHLLWSYTPFWTVNDPYTRERAIYQGIGLFDALAWSR